MRTVVSLSWVFAVALSAPLAVRAQQPVAVRPQAAVAVRPQPVATVRPQQPAAVAAPAARPAQVATVPAGDPYGFTAWLNATRASYGLPAVGYDPNLANWAASNNAQQQLRGIGHFVMGPARRQN